jgi:hypothetical protein
LAASGFEKQKAALMRGFFVPSFRDAPPELGFTRVRQYHSSKSATADLDAQARNPYSRSWLWIPGSFASLTPLNDEY